MIEFKLINPEMSELWNQMMDLRYSILRQPWGEAKGSEQAKDDFSSLHGVILKSNDEIIGTCRSHLVDKNAAQFRFMAISERYQGLGHGKKLVHWMEDASKNEYSSINKIILHAREPAVPFYQSLHYNVVEPSYLLFGSIPHFLMEKNL